MTTNAETAEQRITLKIDGMTCAACVHTVQTALQRVGGVSDAIVSLGDDTATITYDSSSTEVRQMMAAVDSASKSSK